MRFIFANEGLKRALPTCCSKPCGGPGQRQYLPISLDAKRGILCTRGAPRSASQPPASCAFPDSRAEVVVARASCGDGLLPADADVDVDAHVDVDDELAADVDVEVEVEVEVCGRGGRGGAAAQSAVGESASALDLLSGGRPFTSSRQVLLSFREAALLGATLDGAELAGALGRGWLLLAAVEAAGAA